ncbi:ATP-binding protein [Solwaraspora sp. WMMD406]|uniref:ATP-binding protein n=1 Tax=Solwaraspora sp. WMMD406 TaxID=3016095 RepID=UPI002416F039|nr:ATP-binding protein [Solwaraspora sp. WMMD406]MDG4763135.1 ATP-binding protein [Solwaraspora sp. WMMD406]
MTVVLAGRTWSVLVPHHVSGARLARHKLATALANRVRPTLLSDVMAVVAELVGNAVRHARPLPDGMVRITCQLIPLNRGATVRIKVTDGGSGSVPQVRSATADALNGRGLSIVAALAQRWGVEKTGSGRCVWAEIACPDPPAA